MRFTLVLGLTLALFWLALSFYFTPLLLTFGVLSVGLVLVLVSRMRIMDGETAPYAFVPQTLSYFTWLFREIAKANAAVVRAVMSPDVTISPTLVKIPVDRSTDMGRVMFANSITLTPGTVSVDVTDDHILVHALLEEMSDPADFTEMQARAGASIGEPISPSEAAFLRGQA